MSDIEKEDELRPLHQVFSVRRRAAQIGEKDETKDPENLYGKLEQYVATYGNSDFCRIVQERFQGAFTGEFGAPDDGDATLNVRGIYKRLRHNLYTLRNQRAIANLDWELGRFDLLGTRLDCLYKNQAFAIYEQLWNVGDPFFSYKLGDGPCPLPSEFVRPAPQERQRWLCLRTNVLRGRYNAQQIAALVDPNAIKQDHWADSLYNLCRTQLVLGALYRRFLPDDSARYRKLATSRNRLRHYYCKWHEAAEEVYSIRLHDRPDAQPTIWFGSFLGESAVDYVLCAIDEYRRSMRKEDQASDSRVNDLGSLLKSLNTIARLGAEYTTEMLKSMTGFSDGVASIFSASENSSLVQELPNAAKELYDCLERRLRLEKVRCVDGPKPSNAAQRDELSMWSEWIRYASAERDYFVQCLEHQMQSNAATPGGNARKKCLDAPVLFVSGSCVAKAAPLETPCSVKEPRFATWCDEVYQWLEQFRQGQRNYLFYRGKATAGGPQPGPKHPGVWLRETANVLNIIKNLVLLYDPGKDNENLAYMAGPTNEANKKRKPRFVDDDNKKALSVWTSYDLFFYLRSLVPLEIQVRTKLAGTMADQYHDRVYKARPPLVTEFPRTRMENVGGQIDVIDSELEIDLEDYIARWCVIEERPKVDPNSPTGTGEGDRTGEP